MVMWQVINEHSNKLTTKECCPDAEEEREKCISPTLRCVLQLRISRPQWVFFNGVKGQTGVIVQSDPSISINGSLMLGQR